MLQAVGKARGQHITGAPFDDASAAVLARTLKTLLAHWQARLLHRLRDEWSTRGIAKADDDGKQGLWQWIDDVIDDALDRPSAVTMRDISSAMTQANAGAAGHAVRQIDLDDPQAISLRSRTEAVNYAAHRSAELVGKKYDADGNLIDNPDADWAITDTMRKVLRDEIRDAVGLHQDVDRLADRLEQTGLFSDARAEMIARTEINMAQNQGVLEAGRQAKAAGLDVRKVWTLGDNPCPACEEAAAEGDIDLEADFGDEAGEAPPLHPNCECNLDLFVADEEEEAKMQDDDSDDDRFDANGGDHDRHVIDTLADLIAEAGTSDGKISRQDALRWLLHSPHGAALIVRMAHARKRASNGKDSTMTRIETLASIVKRHDGLAGLCRHIVKKGTTTVTEAELTGMITAVAKHEHPDLDDAQAFTKLFAGPNGEMLRRAIMVAKAAPLPEPEQVGGDDVDVDDPAKALAQLKEMIAELRRHARNLSESEAWNRVVRDHPALAKRAIAA
jgi:hypothetical protein